MMGLALRQVKSWLPVDSYRIACALYLLLFVLLTFNYWGRGEVIAPYRQHAELGLADRVDAQHRENRKFSDFANGYIPEVQPQVAHTGPGWLPLWSKQNEIGRPLFHTSGFSVAYPPSWIISHLCDSPWRFMTILSLSLVFLSGLFVLCFCRETGIAPMAGLIAGCSLAFSPFLTYWLTFPMFGAALCWSAMGLWGLARLARKADLASWSILAFSAYSLPMTAYPQMVVYHAYLLAGYGLVILWRQLRKDRSLALRYLLLAASAALLGGALALPVYLDVAGEVKESLRVMPPVSFFTVVLPRFATALDAFKFVAFGTVPELFGEPAGAAFPYAYNAISVTLPVLFFAVAALFTRLRQHWGWWLAVLCICLLTFVDAIYTFGVQHLGLNLSRTNPLCCLLLPLTIITAYGVDGLLKDPLGAGRSRAVLLAAAVAAAVLLGAFVLSRTTGMPIRPRVLGAMAVMLVLLLWQLRSKHPAWPLAATAMSLVITTAPLMLHQDPRQIATSSPLAETIRAGLTAGARFAVAAPGLPVLPPNLNASVGLPSVHSYNSLSSRRYHTLMDALGGDVLTFGRLNSSIAPDYGSAMFWMTNVGAILSATPLAHSNLRLLGDEAGIHVYQVLDRMGEAIQVVAGSAEGAHDLVLEDPRGLQRLPAAKRLDQTDVLEFDVTPGQASWLVLSQKYHRDWQAQVLAGGTWREAPTGQVNGVFQGVKLAPDATQVRLRFMPFVRYAWIAHAFWLLVLALLLARRLRGREI
ncbi:hypothetical protein SAMN05518865_109204 [Duganella sp. CF458]|uniref:hypothetical protein n=1 Tax=Duganella sp. CF458 TaxID=1884368 RepID=UPI0008F0BFE6|nr:hypothetical protein [Duganella sp. CF458]SFG21046.1 hypothetical protein SAMN05518865_109204 [Duganella sp. CF458]